MKNKVLKYLSYSFIILFCMLVLSGCSIIRNALNKEQQINNIIENHYIEYSTTIKVEDIEQAIIQAAEIAKSSCVGISVASSNFITTSVNTGSGVIIKKEQLENNLNKYYVITNRHVTGTKTDAIIKIYLGDEINQYINATYVAYDEQYDLALLTFTTGILFNAATINQNTLKAGQYAIAIGSPYDLETYYNSVSVGSISSPSRICDEEGASGKIYQHEFIQHTAVLNSGNSGGGLFNIKGELIGINTFKIVGDLSDKYEGLNFSIPIKVVLIRFNKYL